MTEAQKAEARATTIPVEFEGHTYQVDPTDLTWAALEADRRGDASVVIRTWLGEEQWATFTERHPRPLTRNKDGVLLNVSTGMRLAILAALGNSEASSPS